MADKQRIHPSSDLEAAQPRAPQSPPPSAPLIPPSAVRSEKPDDRHPVLPYPPPPAYAKPRQRHRCRLRRCLCCTLCTLLLLLILIIGVFAAVLFLGFHPKIPHFSIDGIRATKLNFTQSTDTLAATFVVNITARNPNKRIGIYYEDGSQLSVWYSDTELCEGSLPVFYQGHRNTTVMQVPLSGQTDNATALAGDLQADGGVSLLIRGKVPVKVKMGKLKLMKMRFKARCELVVDNVRSNSEISIKSSSCKIKLNRIFGITF